MPYRRRRTYRRRPRYRRSRPTVRKQIYRIKRSMPKVEYKNQDVQISQNPVITPNGAILLNGISQDVSADGRIGTHYTIKTIQFKLKYTLNASATDTIVRTVIFWDKQANGLTPTVSGNLFVGESVTSLKQPFNAYRYRILYDKNVALCTNGVTETYRQYYKRLTLKVLCNNGTAGDITDIRTGALYILFISDEATNTPTVSGSVRIWYTDV